MFVSNETRDADGTHVRPDYDLTKPLYAVWVDGLHVAIVRDDRLADRLALAVNGAVKQLS